MKDNIIRIKLNDEIFNRIDYLNFSILSHEQLLSTIMQKSKYEFNKEIYDYYMDNYNKVNTELRLIIRELLNTHKDELELDVKRYRYNINFDDQMLELEII